MQQPPIASHESTVWGMFVHSGLCSSYEVSTLHLQGTVFI